MTCSCGNPMCDGTCCNNAACCSDTTCNTGNIVSVSNAACVTDCGCLPATPIPYYNSAPGCEETHSRLVIQNQFVTGLSIATAFNMPACDGTAMLTIPGLQLVSLGSYLWNAAYGYLKVESFDYASSTIIVKNECQDGNIAAGTAIPACTIFNVVDTPVGIDNPCTNSPVAAGALVVCADGVTQPLDAASVGQIPVVTNAATNEVEFQSLEIPERVCVELLADITLIPGNAGPYTLNVASTSGYTLNTILQIAGRADRFTVQTTPDITHATAIVSPVPGGFEVIPSGSDVCLAPCCEQVALDALTYTDALATTLNGQVSTLATTLNDQMSTINGKITTINNWIAAPCTWNLSSRVDCGSNYYNTGLRRTGYSLDVGADVEIDITPDVTIDNTTCKSMNCFYVLTYAVDGGFSCANGDYADIEMMCKLAYTVSVPPVVDPVPFMISNVYKRHEAFHKAGSLGSPPTVNYQYTWANAFRQLVSAGRSIRLRTSLNFKVADGTAGVIYRINSMVCTVNYFSLAI